MSRLRADFSSAGDFAPGVVFGFITPGGSKRLVTGALCLLESAVRKGCRTLAPG